MVNRKIPPPVHTISNLHLPKPEKIELSNGIPVYVLNYPKTEILKLEVVYRASRPEEEKHLVSRATARLLRDGTDKMSAAEIAEHIDFFGGTFANPSNMDTSNFLLFSQKKYFQNLVPVFAEALQSPVFPERELENFRRTGIADLKLELEKPEVVAYRKITELIFGESHPYGYNSTETDYEALTINDLKSFFEKWYTPSNCLIFVSGNVDGEILQYLETYFGKNTKSSLAIRPVFETPSFKSKTLNLPHKDSMQKAIKIGRRLFNKLHADFAGVFVLNTILGGYFGSRLMTNIREKKGYTYNIYSSADALIHDGCFYIASEVNQDSAKLALREIFREMKKLRETPISEEELAMVKNYLLGTFLTSLDGPMNASEVVRGLIIENLPENAFVNLVDTILHISPDEILKLANQYLNKKDFWQVVVG